MKKSKIVAKRALSVILTVLMVLSSVAAGVTVMAAAADWVYIPGQTGRVAKDLYVKIGELWQGTSALIGDNDYIIDENGKAKSVDIVTDVNKSTSLYTTETGSETWWAYTDYIVGDSDLQSCVYTREGSGALYNETSKKYIVNNGTTGVAMSSSPLNWTTASNRIYCTSGSMCVTSDGQVALRSSSSTNIYAYKFVQTVYVDAQTSGGYYKYAGPETYNITAGDSLTTADIEKNVTVQFKTSANASTYETYAYGTHDISLVWDKALNTNVAGAYDAQVKVGQTTVGTIRVNVEEAQADPEPYTDPGTDISDWKHIEGTVYEPVTIYKNVSESGMVNGRTYRLGVYYYDTVLTVSSNGALSLSFADTPLRDELDLYTSDDGSDVPLKISDYYTEDDLGSDFVWNNGTLYNPDTGRYIVNSGTTLTTSTSTTNASWTYNNNRLSKSIQSGWTTRTYYIRNSNNSVVLGTSNSNGYIYFYEKTTAYKKTSSGEGGYYKYNGNTDFVVDKGSNFDDSYILNQISVLYKADRNVSDADSKVLTMKDSAITFKWNNAVNTANEGTYTGTVYANGVALETISVKVQKVVETKKNAADPSTSRIEDKFTLTHDDDGKVLADKTVQYGSDEYNAFDSYDKDEFSVALSALGQSYEVVSSEEIVEEPVQVHPDVVFVIDASGSMRVYNVAGSTTVCRGEATAAGLNTAIKELYAQDPETRIGIVTFGFGVTDGVYLPLDKYTLPEGQEDYITWNGMMVAKPQSSSDISGIVSAVTPVVSGAVSTTTYFYPGNKTVSTTNTTSQLRYQINTSGRIRIYGANSTSYTTLSSALSSGNYVEDTTNGYVIYRSGNNYYVYTKADFDNYKASLASGGSSLAYDVKTVASSGTLSSIKTISKWPGYQQSNNVWSYYKPSVSEMTKIATTASGKTYYVAVNGDMTFIFDDECPMAVAFMAYNNSTYSSTFVTDEISVELTSASSLKYTTYTYEKETGTTLSFENHEYVMATNFLINSNGETVKPSSYHFVAGIGTFTQAGLQAAENMFRETGDKDNRVPALVLISDGIPTVSDADVNDPELMMKVGTTSGYGLSTATDEVNSQFLCNHGLRTIETAMKAKKNINNMYAGSHNREGLLYTIGPGVDYIFGQTVLNPTNENVAAAAAKTTNVGENTESGVGVPSDLAKTISSKYSDLSYVDYADWSFTGDMSSDELSKAFKKIVTSILATSRPVSMTATGGSAAGVGDGAAMVFTDVIGDGMTLTSDLVVRYGDTNYAPTGKTTETLANGNVVTSYVYDYRVNEESTHTAYSLKGLTVQVITAPDGTQTVKWYIPAELIPIIIYDGFEEEFIRVSPIRLLYQVSLDEASKTKDGTFYTNSLEDPAYAQYTPAVGNPYYYNNVKESDGKTHSRLKQDNNTTTTKVENPTDTVTYSTKTVVDYNGDVTTDLGNNGKIEQHFSKVIIKKVWDDKNNVAGIRPDSIKVQILRNGTAYGSPITLSTENCEVTKDANGNDVWSYTIEGLPYDESYTYTVSEVAVDGYNTTVSKSGDETTITNALPKAVLEYDLYLVDKNGKPVNQNGDRVDFEDRVVMSELVKLEQYINTTEEIDLDELQKLVPAGYQLFNPATSYTQTFNGVGDKSNSAIVADDENGTTKVTIPDTATIGSDGKVSGMGDYSKTHVTFAIVKVQIVPDAIVVDFGIPEKVHVLVNDLVSVGGTLTGIGTALTAGTVTETGTYAQSRLAGTVAKTEGTKITLTHGKAYFKGDYVAYEPTDMVMSNEDVLYYEFTDMNGKHMYTTVTVIPAANIYYEDSFVTFHDNGDYKWQTAGSTYTDVFQAEDRPGEFEFEGYDADNVYGRDTAYDNNSTTYSLGSARYAVVDAASVGSEPTATFTFSGTGFDFFSCTNSDTGAVLVDVKQNGKAVKKLIVQTYYGYTYGQAYVDADGNYTTESTGTPLYLAPEVTEDVLKNTVDGKAVWTTPTYYEEDGVTLTTTNTGKPAYAEGWIPSATGEGLYQVPVIRVRDLAYGTYDVTITPKYAKTFDMNYKADSDSNSYKIYVDAVRIYDPAGNAPDVNSTIGNAYAKDFEYAPNYLEIRKQMLDAETFFDTTADAKAGEFTPGCVFIDGIAALNSETLTKDAVSNNYLHAGPNNELYLSKGQAVAFYIASDKAVNPESLQLGMKTIAGGVTSLAVMNTNQTAPSTITVSGGTEQYRKLTQFVEWDEAALAGGTYRTKYPIVIANTSDTVVSLTSFKWTYEVDPSVFTFDSVDGAEEGLHLAVTSSTPKMAMKALGFMLEEADNDAEEAIISSVKWEKSTIYRNGTAVMNVVTSADAEVVTVNGKEATLVSTDKNGNKTWQYSEKVTESGSHGYTVAVKDSNGNTKSTTEAATLTVKADSKTETGRNIIVRIIEMILNLIRKGIKR